MTSSSWLRIVVGIALSGWLLLLPGALRGDYRQSYLDGVRAARKGDWDRVIRRMREAIAEEPTAKERARLVGSILDPYLPHYYLGKAYYEKRDCGAALDAWEISREQQAIRSQPELDRELEQGVAHCANRRRAAAAIAAADDEAGALAAAIAELPEVWERDPALEGRRRRAAAKLAQARNRLAESRATWTPEPSGVGAEPASEAGAELSELTALLRRRHAGQRRAALADAVAASAGAGRRALAAAAERPATAGIRSASAELERLLDRFGTVDERTPLAELEALRDRLPGAIAGLREVIERLDDEAGIAVRAPEPEPVVAPEPTVAVPDWLVDAAQATFDGDYARALAILAQHPVAAGRARFYARLFRAAARHGLYLVGGERDASLLRAATADLRECLGLDPSFVPPASYFSPRFIEFFSISAAEGESSSSSP